VDIRFYLDPDTGLPHIYGHGVTEEAVEQVLRASGGDIQGSRGSRMKLRPDLGRALSPGHLLARRGTGERLRDHRLRADRQGQEGVSPATTEETAMSDQKFPPGWDEARIREVIEHYDSQDEDERAAEIEAAWEAEGMTLMSVPTELVPEIRVLLARKQTA